MEIEIAENTFPKGMSIRETRIRCPITSKPHWSTGNQWKSRSLEKVGIQTEAAAKSRNVDRSGTEAPVFVDRLSAKIDFFPVDALSEVLQIGEFEASFMCQKIQLVTNRTIKLLFTEKLFLMVSSKPKAWTRAESTWK